MASLCDLGEWRGGGTPSKLVEDYWNGNIPWVSPKDMKLNSISDSEDHITERAVDSSATKLIPRNSILCVTRSGILAHTFPVAISKVPVTVNQDIKALTPFEGIDARFLAWALRAQSRHILQTCSKNGTTVNSIESSRLYAYRVPVAPHREQLQVVAKIEELFSELDDGIQSLTAAREQLKVYRHAVLKYAFDGKLTARWREDNQSSLETAAQHLTQLACSGATISDSDCKKLGTLPNGWAYVRLGQIIDEPKYGTSKKCVYETKGVGVIRIPNIVSGVIDDSDLKFAQFDDDEIQAYGLRRGDILIIRSNGSISIVGKCAVVRSRDEKYLHAGYLIRIRPNKKVVDSDYLYSVLSCHALRVQIEAKAKSTSGVNNINSGELQSLIIPLCSVEEQTALLARLSQALTRFDQLETEIDQQLKMADALRQSILKNAFSGKLVAQDPNDEPASVLLERIRSEKAENEDGKKKTRRKDAA